MEEMTNENAYETAAENAYTTDENGAANTASFSKTDGAKAYSQRLNKDREAIRSEYEAEYGKRMSEYAELEDNLRALGYEGENALALSESLKKALSEKDGAEEAQAEKEKENDALLERAAEIAMLQRRMADAREIRKAYPEADFEDAADAGEIYVKLMATGELDAVTAYEAQMAYNKRHEVPRAASMGEVKANGKMAEKDFYTPAEAEKLTRKDYDSTPGLWEKVRASMLKW